MDTSFPALRPQFKNFQEPADWGQRGHWRVAISPSSQCARRREKDLQMRREHEAPERTCTQLDGLWYLVLALPGAASLRVVKHPCASHKCLFQSKPAWVHLGCSQWKDLWWTHYSSRGNATGLNGKGPHECSRCSRKKLFDYSDKACKFPK